MMEQLTLTQIWAKTEPFQSILTHSVISGVVSQVLLEQMLAPGVRDRLCRAMSCNRTQLKQWVGYLVSLHDIGKVEGQFQCRWPEMRRQVEAAGLRPQYFDERPVRHEQTTGYCLRHRIWAQAKNRRAKRFYASILAAHHQGKTGIKGNTQEPFWNQKQEELECELRKRFLGTETLWMPAVDKPDQGAVGALLLGIVILADWIASSDCFSQAEEWMSRPDSQERVEERAGQFLQLSGLAYPQGEFGTGFSDVWPNIPKTGMRGLQKEVEALFHTAGERISLVLLEAPMGEGKTEAGVYAALQMERQWGKSGFYVGLPTAATSNQMAGRMRALLELHQLSGSVRLLHSMAWLAGEEDVQLPEFETEEARYAAGWLLPVRRGLLSPYAVGTVDQAMMSVLVVKYGVLRLLGLAGKALVIDELHAYDVYMSEILRRLLEWCRALEIPVVLLSATLPPEKKAQMFSAYTDERPERCYPAVTAVTESGKMIVRPVSRTERRQTVRVSLCPLLHREEELARMAAGLVEQGGCICVLLNTVKQAQAVYSVLRAVGFDGELLLFHARFPAGQRDEIEGRCIRLFGKDKTHRPKKAILVATQVVEQSLDVDFDAMITAVAPMDLLLQRLGREFRHEDTYRPAGLDTPGLYVLTPERPGDFGADGFIYPPCLLSQSIHLLELRTEIRIPEDLPELVTQGYDQEAAPQEELTLWMEHLMDEQVKAATGGIYAILPPEKGFSPITAAEQVQFDDLERSGYLSAKTRLGEPSVRIAILPEPRYQQFRKRAQMAGERLTLSHVSKEEAREIWRASVSVRSKLLGQRAADVIWGEKLLQGVEIYPGIVEPGGKLYYHLGNGTKITADPELGVMFEEDVREGDL